MDELEAQALLCRLLPDLRAGAEAGRWISRLEATVQRVRGGGSTLEALTALGLDPCRDKETGSQRSGPGPHILWGSTPAEISGDYVCPQKPRCGRRGNRDAQGHPPVCELRDILMTFEPS
jgi:hypothetical protein